MAFWGSVSETTDFDMKWTYRSLPTVSLLLLLLLVLGAAFDHRALKVGRVMPVPLVRSLVCGLSALLNYRTTSFTAHPRCSTLRRPCRPRDPLLGADWQPRSRAQTAARSCLPPLRPPGLGQRAQTRGSSRCIAWTTRSSLSSCRGRFGR